jgi:AcrR family transcriptional regulator
VAANPHTVESDTAGLSTRERILEIARDLFTSRTYAGTSMQDIAERLGTTKSALYYHFKSKEEILDALLAESIARLSILAELAQKTRPRARPEELLGGLIDFFAGSTVAHCLFGNDPSAKADYVRRHNPGGTVTEIVAALAGPRAGTSETIRAHAALAAAKEGTSAALAIEGALSANRRQEILDTALRALARK